MFLKEVFYILKLHLAQKKIKFNKIYNKNKKNLNLHKSAAQHARKDSFLLEHRFGKQRVSTPIVISPAF